MEEPASTAARDSIAGLCPGCAHSRRVDSARGSTFILCELSRTDPRFHKYPRLPVLTCVGYQPAPESATKQSS
jgi:hypothetical protein